MLNFRFSLGVDRRGSLDILEVKRRESKDSDNFVFWIGWLFSLVGFWWGDGLGKWVLNFVVLLNYLENLKKKINFFVIIVKKLGIR